MRLFLYDFNGSDSIYHSQQSVLLHSVYQCYKKFCFVLTKRKFRNRTTLFWKILSAAVNLAIRILWICVKQLQNILKWNRLHRGNTFPECKVAEDIWTCHSIALSDFSDLPLDSSLSGPSHSLRTGPSSAVTFIVSYWFWQRRRGISDCYLCCWTVSLFISLPLNHFICVTPDTANSDIGVKISVYQ